MPDYISQLTTHALEYYAASKRSSTSWAVCWMMLPPPRLPTLPTACGIPTATCTPPNGISKSTVETYLLNAQKAKAILNLTYGADGAPAP